MSCWKRVCFWLWGDGITVAPTVQTVVVEEDDTSSSPPAAVHKPLKSILKKSATTKRQRRIVEIDTPPGKRSGSSSTPVDMSDRGLARIQQAPSATFQVHGQGTRLIIVVHNRKTVVERECWLLDRELVRERLADIPKSRLDDVATWEPELFWNAHYYKLIARY